MTVVRFKNTLPNVSSFNNLLSDVFPQMPSLYRETLKTAVQVNISETDNAFLLELVAPGWAKEDFEIGLDHKTLTVSVAQKAEQSKENVKFISRQFRPASFNRSFTLNDTIDAENIAAEYQNGILQITLGKKAETAKQTRRVKIV